MAAKQHGQYVEEANELAKKLEITIVTDGLDYRQIQTLVGDLRAKLKDQETHTQADGGQIMADKESKTAKPEEKQEKKNPEYVVNVGKAIPTRGGIKTAGMEISERNFRDLKDKDGKVAITAKEQFDNILKQKTKSRTSDKLTLSVVKYEDYLKAVAVSGEQAE